ncbi:MAG: PfkB family carbohydrate kinase [Candidatus Bathyarchaeia archaeon]
MFDCVGIGFHCVDLLLRITEMPSFKEHRSARVLNFDMQGGGPVSTGLVTMARLGAKVGYLGKVGDDYWGDFIIKEYKKYGVDISQLVVEKGKISPCVVVLVEATTGERVFLVLPSNLTSLRLNKAQKMYIAGSKLLFLAGWGRSIIEAAKIANSNNIPVFVDGLATGDLKGLVDIAICSEEHAYAATHTRDPIEALKRLSADGYKIVGITLGSKGSVFEADGKIIRQDAFKVKVIDTTGAGDVFHGAFGFGLLQGWDINKIIEFASAVSALKCTKLGGRAGIPTFDEVLDFLKKHKSSYFS